MKKLLLAATLVCMIILACSVFLPLTKGDWVMFRSDPAHDGIGAGSAPLTPTLIWSYTTGDWVWSSPSVASGVLYVGSFDGNVYAFNAATGAKLWSYTTGDMVCSSPDIANGIVYICSSPANISESGKIYEQYPDENVWALNANTGAKLWNFSMGINVPYAAAVWESSPTVVNGIVYVGSFNSYVYALNATTGAQIWSHSCFQVHSTPTVVNGIVYIGSTDNNVYALNATTGAQIWSYATGDEVWSTPCVVNNVVYIGSFDSNVYALNANTGAKLWNYTTDTYIESSPAVVNGVVYIGSGHGILYALNAASGALIWDNPNSGDAFSCPAVVGNEIYVGSIDPPYSVYAFNIASGTLTWNYTVSGEVRSSPTVVNGIVYAGSFDGNVYAIGTSTNPTVTISPTSATLDVGQFTTFTATPSGGSGVYSHYQWYVGGTAQSGQTASTFIFTPLSPASYSITATVTDNSGNTSAQSNVATVTVNTSPTVSISPAGPIVSDVGQNQTFMASASGGSGSLSYQWYLDGAAVGTNSTNYFYTAATGSHSVTCKVTDSASTPVTSPSSNAVSITVNPALVAPTASATPVAVDPGQTSNLSSTAVTTGTSPYTYQWFEKAPNGNYLKVGTNSSSFSFVTSGSTPMGSWSFILQVTDSTNAAVNSTSATVTVSVYPTVSVTPASWAMDVGQSKTFTAVSSGGSGSYLSYQWFVNGVNQTGQTASTFNYSASSAGSPLITVAVTDSLGATSAQSTAPSVTVAASPAVSISPAGPLVLDVGQSQNLTATSSGGSGTISYQWYLDGNKVGTNSSSYSYAALLGSHSVTCNVIDNASSPVTSPTSIAVSITVNSALVAPSPSPSPGTVDQGQASNLTSAAVATGTSPYTYQWFSETPGTSTYSLINGATLSTYNFATTSTTAVGTWGFILQVTDNTGLAINSTVTSVTVNAPTPTPTPTATTTSSPPASTPTTSPASTPTPTTESTTTTTPTQSTSPESTPTPTTPQVPLVIPIALLLFAVAAIVTMITMILFSRKKPRSPMV